ncbi:unnamed protein product [Clavelina lepadiformis]|uniref:4-coumarate--CoA ligase n=1 Tax=Clavelina lepadiformis TaxID=159417 RepID=A0ABP0F1I8_CLALP
MPIKSVFPDICVPEVNFAEYVLKTIQQYPPTKTALVSAFNEKSYTYQEIAEIVRKCASFLKRSGLQKGDIVALCSPNIPEFMFVFLATALCGSTITTCNPLYTSYEIMQQFKDSKPVFVFTVPEHAKKVKAVTEQLPTANEVIVFGDYVGFRSFKSLISVDDGTYYPNNVKVDVFNDILVLPYSSGTTGNPKGVMLSHYSFVSSLFIVRIYWKTFLQDVEYLVLPLFHIYGMLRSFSYLEQGSTLVLDERFDLERMAKAIETYKVTSCAVVPPMLLAFAKSNIEQTHNLSTMKSMIVGAAPVSPSLATLVAKKLNCNVDLAWGMTETSGVPVILNKMAWRISSDASGLVAPLNSMKVCDLQTGKELGPNEVGELLVKGPEIMLGYYNNPVATANTLEKDGFLHTGDIGYYDEFNQFYVKDRAKELIKYKGFQVPPAEIEHVLMDHPEIADAAVIGIPDEEAGEVPMAFVVKRIESLSASQVQSFVKGEVYLPLVL